MIRPTSFASLNPVWQEDRKVLRFDCPCGGELGCGQKVRLRLGNWTVEGELPNVTIRPSVMDGSEEGRKHFHIVVTNGVISHTP